MNGKAYDYMDWPGIEAIIYGEEVSPKDIMAPRLTPDGILLQGFFPEAEKAVEGFKEAVRGIRNTRTEMNVPVNRKTSLYIVGRDADTCVRYEVKCC